MSSITAHRHQKASSSGIHNMSVAARKLRPFRGRRRELGRRGTCLVAAKGNWAEEGPL